MPTYFQTLIKKVQLRQPIPQNRANDTYLQERFRQAQQSFNLALVMTSASTIIGFAGVGIALSGKPAEGAITTTGGFTSCAYCLRLAKDANDRLDRIAAEQKDE